MANLFNADMISFIVSSFNEEANLAKTVETIRAAVKDVGIKESEIDIILVNDGSADGTGRIADALQSEHPFTQTINHPTNLGIGMTIRNGIKAAKGEQFILVPGDNDMSRDFLGLMLSYRGFADIVISLPINHENRTLFRNVLSEVFRIFFMIAFRIYLNYLNGPCIYPTKHVQALTIRSKGVSIIAEINTKVMRMGCTYCEVPGYFQTGTKPSKLVSFRNILGVALSYIGLILEVHLWKRSTYNKTSRRVFVNLTGASPRENVEAGARDFPPTGKTVGGD